jgi:lipopolysaccharide export LptBFGC system permease protein LptF
MNDTLASLFSLPVEEETRGVRASFAILIIICNGFVWWRINEVFPAATANQFTPTEWFLLIVTGYAVAYLVFCFLSLLREAVEDMRREST